MKHILKSVHKRLYSLLYKNKTFKSEDEFYTHFFTKNPSWSSPEPNEDENIRWAEIRQAIDATHPAKNIDILEIGCGRGWLTNCLRQYGTPVGIEPVAAVVKYAKKIFPGIGFHAMLPSAYIEHFPGKTFDLVVSSEVLEHATDKQLFVQDIHRLLKPGGTVVITTPRAEHYKDFIDFYGEEVGQPVEEWVSEKELENLFVQNGFEVAGKKFFAPLSAQRPGVLMTQLWTCRKK